jgi:hypothetical protein
VLLLIVIHRSCAAIFEGEADRVKDVEEHVHQQENPNDPEQRAQFPQLFRVRVHPLRPEKNLEVAEQMTNDECDQDHAGHRHDHLFAD